MVLIICHHYDYGADEVINWLAYNGKSFSRCSFNEFIQNFTLTKSISNGSSDIDTINHRLINKSIESIWFRRNSKLGAQFEFDIEKDYFLEMLTGEQNIIKKIFLDANSSKNIRYLSSFNTVIKDKIAMLEIAKSCRLDIPNTLITNNKKELSLFFSKNKQIICKACSENLSIEIDGQLGCMQYVNEVFSHDIDSFPNFFFPSLFQKKIDKEMDIRVFYLNGCCYSMGIFSFKTDFREDYVNHRYVPMKLPKNIESSIMELMSKLNFNTGSIDFVKSKDDSKYYFLEVNPNGFFSMVSIPCNYYLEKKIAEFLINEK